jgi:hypothetical protein
MVDDQYDGTTEDGGPGENPNFSPSCHVKRAKALMK